MFQKVKEAFSGKHKTENSVMIKGSVVLMKKNVLDLNDMGASCLDGLVELFGKRVSFQLVSASELDPSNENKGRAGKAANIDKWVGTMTPLHADDSIFGVTFEWEPDLEIPGAVIVKNHHCKQFFLKSLTLHDYPTPSGNINIHFDCNSWVYPTKYYKYNRIFFTNKSYLPRDTPQGLRRYREEELVNLRGNGSGRLKEYDRVYDYDYYNDLGEPHKGPDYARPVLGGSKQYPYPRRGRTGRPYTKSDPASEKRLPLLSLDIYVPRDERFGHIKFSDFLAYALKSLVQVLVPELKAVFDKTPNEFDTFEDVMKLYSGGLRVPNNNNISIAQKLRNMIPLELLRELLRSDGERCCKFPTPQVIQIDKTAWRTDEEFAREMLAGVNPVIISRLQEFPPKSKLDPDTYGIQNSSIREEDIIINLDGLTVEEAVKMSKLFILDHHDTLMPYVRRINTTATKMYATRTILLLKDDGTLTPLAIELSLPHPDGDKHGAISKVFTPAHEGVKGSIWQLAKAFVAVSDSGYHQLISHWLNTHAVIEPFVIATNRQMSVLHPIHKLLSPHYRDTMNINALARQILINAGGLLEHTVFPGRYSMEMSSVIYKNWIFTEQALPADLIKRGMAVEDPNCPHNLRLLIEDYPYAVDGLQIWSAIQTWVQEYCNIYYSCDASVQADTELQAWWAEVRQVGHGDKCNEPWWPKMDSLSDLIQSCTIIIWIASALHAALNFGQYSYAGYLPNRPTISRRFMPEPNTPEYTQLDLEPDVVFLRTITAQLQTLLGVSLIEILSRHSSDEVYLGQRATLEWTADVAALEAFERFGQKLREIESKIVEMNNDVRWKNRVGPVEVPYTLLYPNTSDNSGEGGLTGKGIPNSVSI